MDDLYPCEPLNLVKREKNASVVSPTSVNEDDQLKVRDSSISPITPNDNTYFSFLTAAAALPYDPNLFNSMYINGLMNTQYMNGNLGYGYYSYNSLQNPLHSNPLAQLFAQQQLQQVINWNETRRNSELVSEVVTKSLNNGAVNHRSFLSKTKTENTVIGAMALIDEKLKLKSSSNCGSYTASLEETNMDLRTFKNIKIKKPNRR